MRIQHGLTQREMAKVACVGVRTYQRYESGKRAVPKAIIELVTLRLKTGAANE